MFVCKSEVVYSAIWGPMQDRVDIGASRIRQPSDSHRRHKCDWRVFQPYHLGLSGETRSSSPEPRKTPQSKASTAPRLIGVGTSSLNLQMRSPVPHNIFKARIKNKSPFHALLRFIIHH